MKVVKYIWRVYNRVAIIVFLYLSDGHLKISNGIVLPSSEINVSYVFIGNEAFLLRNLLLSQWTTIRYRQRILQCQSIKNTKKRCTYFWNCFL